MDDKREVRYALRLRPDLHTALVELARREDRSLNQQLIHMLREGVRRDDRRRQRQQAGRYDAPAPATRPRVGQPDHVEGGPQYQV